MAVKWTEVTERPNDVERQQAHQTGSGGWGGEDTKGEILIQKTMPSGES
jgi:hypothetical protein